MPRKGRKRLTVRREHHRVAVARRQAMRQAKIEGIGENVSKEVEGVLSNQEVNDVSSQQEADTLNEVPGNCHTALGALSPLIQRLQQSIKYGKNSARRNNRAVLCAGNREKSVNLLNILVIQEKPENAPEVTVSGLAVSREGPCVHVALSPNREKPENVHGILRIQDQSGNAVDINV